MNPLAHPKSVPASLHHIAGPGGCLGLARPVDRQAQAFRALGDLAGLLDNHNAEGWIERCARHLSPCLEPTCESRFGHPDVGEFAAPVEFPGCAPARDRGSR